MFCVAGVTLTALGWLWPHAWVRLVALRAATLCVARCFCVAGVACGDIHVTFKWQVWHLQHWVGSRCALGSPVARRSPVAGRHFAWQSWHLATSMWRHPSFRVAGMFLRETNLRRADLWQPCLSMSYFWACSTEKLGDIDLRFAWQA